LPISVREGLCEDQSKPGYVFISDAVIPAFSPMQKSGLVISIFETYPNVYKILHKIKAAPVVCNIIRGGKNG